MVNDRQTHKRFFQREWPCQHRLCGARFSAVRLPRNAQSWHDAGMSGSDHGQPSSKDENPDPSECRNLARNLRRLREARGESQVQLAYRAGLSQNLISELETEKANPKLRTLKALAAYLGVKVAELIAPDDTIP